MIKDQHIKACNVISSALVLDYYAALCALAVNNAVELDWVSRHTCIIGNSNADLLANVGAYRRLCGPQKHFALFNKKLE